MENKIKKQESWKKRNKFKVQVVALIIGVLAPFPLYAALTQGQIGIAVFLFTLLVVSMALTIWEG